MEKKVVGKRKTTIHVGDLLHYSDIKDIKNQSII